MILVRNPIRPHLKTYPSSVVFTLYDQEENEVELDEFEDEKVNMKETTLNAEDLRETLKDISSYVGGEENITESEYLEPEVEHPLHDLYQSFVINNNDMDATKKYVDFSQNLSINRQTYQSTFRNHNQYIEEHYKVTEQMNFCLEIVEVIDPNEDLEGIEDNTPPKTSLDKKFLHYKSPKRDYDYVSVMRIRPRPFYDNPDKYPPIIITKDQIKGIEWTPNKQQISHIQPVVLFKDHDENFEIEAVITKRVKDKDYVFKTLLNGEDVEDYLGRKKLKEYSHFTN